MNRRRFNAITSIVEEGRQWGAVMVGTGLQEAYQDLFDVNRSSAEELDRFFVTYDGTLKNAGISRQEFLQWALIFSLMDDEFERRD